LQILEDTSQEYPGEFMADFSTLLKRAAIELVPKDGKDIETLHGMRNDFVHFTPKGWSIELAGLPRIIDTALRLVALLMRSDRVEYRVSGNRKRRMRDQIKAVRTTLGAMT
jgi:hypothetical protein